MKIKMRPDDVDPPGRNEWAEMNDWLAELRDETQADEARDSQGSRPSEGGPRPASEAQGPTYAEPASDEYANGSAEARWRTGISAEGSTRTESPVETGWPTETSAGSGTEGSAEGSTAAERSADTSTPAEAPVRAVIGDELRMPIMWCEMASCISWHADPDALGEADIRARAIGAGWRIDALGRMTCPQCQQTTVAFRATRPVVLWDRATAITMAARATRGARPGRRTTSPASALGDRTTGAATRAADGPRRPAAGRR